mgnify:CR=1 FL=1
MFAGKKTELPHGAWFIYIESSNRTWSEDFYISISVSVAYTCLLYQSDATDE